MDNKCKDCVKRKLNCHSRCQDYLDFRKKLDEYNDKRRKEYREYESPYYREAWQLRKRKKR